MAQKGRVPRRHGAIIAIATYTLAIQSHKGDGRLTRLGHLYQRNSKVRLMPTNRRLPWAIYSLLRGRR
jgi:hypothetical protein